MSVITDHLPAVFIALALLAGGLAFWLWRRPRAPISRSSSIDEAAIEAAFWIFDAERKRTGSERDAFKGQMRALLRMGPRGSIFRWRRLKGPGVVLIAAGACLLSHACALSHLDAARQDLTATLRVQTSVAQRFSAWDLQHQMDVVHATKDRTAAAAALKAYRDKRAPFMQLAADTQRALDDCAEVLLLSATPEDADAAAGKARAAVQLFRDKFTALQGGG